jgi:insulysin
MLDAGTVDELERIVEENFSAIKNTGREAEKFSGQPCLPEHLQVTCQRRF